MATSRICSIPDCGKAVCSRGYCEPHYRRYLHHGDPLGGGTVRGELYAYLCTVVLTYDGDACLTWPYSRGDHGYATIRLPGNARQTTSVTRILCEKVHGPPPSPDHEAAHSCGKGQEGCVAKRHLSWKTPQQNNIDKIDHGTVGSKLNEDSVRQIRALKGVMLQRDIAGRYGISQVMVSRIFLKKAWAWLV